GPVLSLTQTFVLDHFSNVAFVSGSDGSATSILTGAEVDHHLAQIDNTGQARYILTVGINSTAATTDQSGTVRNQFYYEPYGQTTEVNGASLFEFTGRLPVAPNLYYYRARYYDPLASRFLSEDPLGAAGSGTNYYAYALGDPVDNTDPSGEFAWIPV